MRKMYYNRILCFLLAVVMAFSAVPVGALAQEETTSQPAEVVIEEQQPEPAAEPELFEEAQEVSGEQPAEEAEETPTPPEDPQPGEEPAAEAEPEPADGAAAVTEEEAAGAENEETAEPEAEEAAEAPDGIALYALEDVPVAQPHHASSYYLNSNDDDYRFYMECFNKNGKHTGGIKRQTIIYVHMNQGDIAYFGSSVYNSQVDQTETNTGRQSGCDILVTTPTGQKISYDVIQNGAGYLKNRKQEVNGPKIVAQDKNNDSKYTPLCFRAAVEGTYTFVFHSVTGETATPTSNGAQVKNDTGWSRQGNATVAAWDVTIVGERTGIASYSADETLGAEGSVIPENEEAQDDVLPGKNFEESLPAEVPEISEEPEAATVEAEEAEEASDTGPVLTEEPEEAGEAAEEAEAPEEPEVPEASEEPEEYEEYADEAEAEGMAFDLYGIEYPDGAAETLFPLDNPENYEFKTGRVWADYLAVSSGAVGSNVASISVYVMTDDGYVYKVNFNELIPFGFVFFANNMGFTYDMVGADGRTSTYSLYHSFYDNDNNLNNMATLGVNLYRPNPYPGFENPTGTGQKIYRVFFEEPDISIRPAVEEPGVISDLKLVGMQDNVAYFSQGGRFTFNVEGASSVSIEIDLRESLIRSIAEAQAAVNTAKTEIDRNEAKELLKILTEYSKKGSGVIRLNGAVTHGANSFEWDGTDTAGQYIPVGAYASADINIVTETKAGEIHFPIIDAEGFGTEAKPGGLEVIRLTNPGADSTYIYYNNNPLCYGTIEGPEVKPTLSGSIYTLSDGTRSRYLGNTSSSAGGAYFFRNLNPRQISTLVKDDGEYLAGHLYGKSYSALTAAEKKIVDDTLAFGTTYHHEPTPSDEITMRFYANSSAGGGNQAGIDAWTYYSPHPQNYTINSDFAIVDADQLGTIRGKIFYDANRDTKLNTGEDPLRNVTVQLVDQNGVPVTHTVRKPVFTDDGYFQRDSEGKILYEIIEARFRTTTNAQGEYNFTGVPYPKTGGYTYGVQVLLNSVHRDILQYAPTTTTLALPSTNPAMLGYLKSGVNAIDTASGPDGNRVILGSDNGSGSKNYTAVYPMDEAHLAADEPECDPKNCQFVTLTSDSHYKDFKDIGYVASVPVEFQKNYQIKKEWKGDTRPLSDITVEFYVWDPNEVHAGHTQNGSGLHYRSGLLVGTQKLSAENGWSYTWTEMDSRNQYFFVEYYTKLDSLGQPMYNDRGEERLVLIGSTMPVYSARPADSEKYYTLKGENILYNGHVLSQEPRHYFGDGEEHPDAVTEEEMQTTVDNNSMQYITTYRLTAADNTLITTFCNDQTVDETQYYVWYQHESRLPNFVHMSHQLLSGAEQTRTMPLTKSDDEGHIRGLVVTSLDASFHENNVGNSTDRFTIRNNGDTAVMFTPDDHIYATGTGTRTYKVEYFRDSDGNPADVTINADGSVNYPEGGTVLSWTMTIHVYDVQPDATFYYSPFTEEVVLQEAIPAGSSLTWQWADSDKTSYISSDPRTRTEEFGSVSGSNGVFGNDTYRVPLYKKSVHHLMGTCADIVGIAYSPNGIISEEQAAELTYWDNSSLQFPVPNPDGSGSDGVGTATAYGKGGDLVVDMNTLRTNGMENGQDHINHAALTFRPNGSFKGENGDVFYYKVIIFNEELRSNNVSYDQIDASNGVEMYTYIKLQPDETLTVTKRVQGNVAEFSREFHIKVTLTAKPGSIVNKLVEYEGGGLRDDGTYRISGAIAPGWTGSKTVDLVMRQGDVVNFHHLSAGMTYTVREDDYSSVGYFTPEYTFDKPYEDGDVVHRGAGWSEHYAEGTVSDMNDLVTVTNEKSVPIDVGVTGSDALYRLLLVLILTLGIPLLAAVPGTRRRRRW